MIELGNTTPDVPMIDFGRDGAVLFRLPVLGAPGVPMGITSAFSLFWDKFQSGRTLTEREVSSTWNYFIQTLADAYPDATRQIAMLDEENLKHVITHWVKESGEQGGFDPKVPSSSSR